MRMIFTVAAAVLLAPAANAAVTVYTDEANFLAALSSYVTEDFADATLVPGLSFTSDAGVIGSGLFNDRLSPGAASTLFSFTGATAFGGTFDLSPGGFGSGIQFTLNLSGGGTADGGELRDQNGFYGFISTDVFDSVLMTAGSGPGIETYTLDNLHIGSGGVVPEPATWALMIAGFGMVGLAARRRQSAHTVSA